MKSQLSLQNVKEIEIHFPRLIVGLGNPGSAYQWTRHNVGFLALEAFASKLGVIFKEDKHFLAKVAHFQHHEKKCVLLMPMTYMNLSGKSVQKVADFYKMTTNEILVVSDDAALPFGKLRLRERGSSGGHNGLLSVQEELNTQEFLRLKIGIGSMLLGMSLEKYVLAQFAEEEKELLPSVLNTCVDALLLILNQGVEVAMNRVNPSVDKKIKKVLEDEEKTT